MPARLVRPPATLSRRSRPRSFHGRSFLTVLLPALLLVGCDESSEIVDPPAPSTPTTLVLSTDEVLLSFLGASESVNATVLDQRGEPMDGQTVLWSVPDEAVATVDGDGVVTAQADGVTELIATSGALSASTRVDVRTGWQSVEAGRGHACGLWGHGVAFCWGDDGFGQLGSGMVGEGVATPAPVAADVLFETLALGDAHSCGLSTGGQVLCWGWNAVGQLGSGDVAPSRATPSPVDSDETFVQVTAGAYHTCALTEDDAALCWGGGGGFDDGRDLALGFEPPEDCSTPGPSFSNRCSRVPREVSGGIDFQELSAGLFHSCGIATDGQAWCWGWNRGQLGNGENHADDPEGTAPGYASPVLVDGALEFATISAGNAHSCGVTAAGQGWCWGEEIAQTGALGIGDAVGVSVPTPVDAPATFTRVRSARINSLYNQYSCALDDGGAAWCWGANRNGQLGATSVESCEVVGGQIPCTLSPDPVDSELTFVHVAVGLEFTCGVDMDAGAWCWGINDAGQLGNGGGPGSGVPVPVNTPPAPGDPEV
jgi:alpha-tubulin suppressor-like RCC1 family protein